MITPKTLEDFAQEKLVLPVTLVRNSNTYEIIVKVTSPRN